MKVKTTAKKFYNKWSYKVSIRQKGVAIFRSFDLDTIKEYCKSDDNDKYSRWTTLGKAMPFRNDLFDLAAYFETIVGKEYQRRIEQDFLDIYTNDKNLYLDIAEKFHDKIWLMSEPPANAENLLEDTKNIYAPKYPHNRYKHKVYLLPHKMKDREEKKRFVEWMIKQSPKITCTPAVQKWFVTTDWNWDRRYVLVEDEHTVLMLKLRANEVVGRVYNYVLTVNT